MLTKEAENKRNCARNCHYYNSAREAFLNLLSNLKVKNDEIILMPAYIGQSIKEGSGVFDPIRKLNCNYSFYRVNADLSVDFDDIKKQIENKNVKILFVIHYFGFPQKNIQKIADYCKEKNIILIEDCAHSYSTKINEKTIGDFGDFALYSIHKIFATNAGGILKINKDDFALTGDTNIALSDLFQFVNSDIDEISTKRRNIYNYYMKRLNNTELYDIFKAELPDDIVPLNFPILIKDADRYEIYNKLLEKGVPCVSLWYQLIEEINPETYPISADISKRILNLPVHQDITEEDAEKIIVQLNSLIKQKKIIILGGKPVGAVDMTKYAKETGHHVIVCDYLDRKASPAKNFSNENISYSTADTKAIVDYIKANNVAAVFSSVHEFNINKCLEICNECNLPFYATKEAMDVTSNKKLYKKIFKDFDIPLISQYKIEDKKDYPVLIKPIDGTGAYGIKICNSEVEFQENLQKAVEFSAKGEVLIEQYIKEKEEITTVYIIKDGIPYLASVADRIVKYFDNTVIPLPIAYIWNSKYLDLYEKTIDEKMKKAIQFMNLQNGMLFIQSIVKDNIIMPYDIGFRLSGTQEHVILESVCGYNPLKLLVDYALTGKFGDETLKEKINPHFDCAAAQITFLVKPATISKFEGIEEVEKMPQVIRVIKNKQEGETIPKSALGTLNQVALRIFVKEKTTERLNELIGLIRSKIRVISDKNKDIII